MLTGFQVALGHGDHLADGAGEGGGCGVMVDGGAAEIK